MYRLRYCTLDPVLHALVLCPIPRHWYYVKYPCFGSRCNFNSPPPPQLRISKLTKKKTFSFIAVFPFFRYWWVRKWSAFLPSSCQMFKHWRFLHVFLCSWIPGRWHPAMCRCIHLLRYFRVRAMFSEVSKTDKRTGYIPNRLLSQTQTVVKPKPKTK